MLKKHGLLIAIVVSALVALYLFWGDIQSLFSSTGAASPSMILSAPLSHSDAVAAAAIAKVAASLPSAVASRPSVAQPLAYTNDANDAANQQAIMEQRESINPESGSSPVYITNGRANVLAVMA